MAKKKSPKTEAGKLKKAGMLLSQFIRSIALEKTALVTIDGEDQIVSKAEALARLVWKKALGYTEQKVIKGELTDINYPPDRIYVGLLWDRMEGRAPLMNPDKKDRRSIVDRVSEQGKKRSNKIADSSLKN
jgi:hypothetical protein